MAKFYGNIGFISYERKPGGVFGEVSVERKYRGDLLRNSRRYDTSDKLNDDLNISNEISIVADAYAYQNFHHMRYVEFMGAKWKITNITVDRPRLTLSIGGVYNGEEPAGTP